MKYSLILLLVFILPTTSYSADLNKPYTPTRKEWLWNEIFHTIKYSTDMWQHRIGFLIFIKENTVTVGLTSVNGQEPLTKDQKQKYVDRVKGSVESILETYKWSKDLERVVHFDLVGLKK